MSICSRRRLTAAGLPLLRLLDGGLKAILVVGIRGEELLSRCLVLGLQRRPPCILNRLIDNTNNDWHG